MICQRQEQECPLRQGEHPTAMRSSRSLTLARGAYPTWFGLSKYFCPLARLVYEVMISGESMSVNDISAV